MSNPSTAGPTAGAATGHVGLGIGPNSAINGVRTAYALLVIAWICVGMKLSLKVVQKNHKWKAHDYFAMLALAFATAEVVVIGVDVQDWGEGQHIQTVPKGNLDVVLRLIDHMYIMYECALMCIKLSILCFYLSLFSVKPRFRYATYIVMGFVVVYLFIFIMFDSFRCIHPLKKMWYPYSIKKADCPIGGVKEQKAFGVLNAFADFVILLLPFPVLMQLKMSRTKRMMVGIIFSLGAFTCAIAIVRTVVIWKTLENSDATWVIGPEVTWMNVEMLVGLICGALLSSPALFRHIVHETRVGQSLYTLLTRRSRGSHERMQDNERDQRDPTGPEWDRHGTPKSSLHHAKSIELRTSSMSSANAQSHSSEEVPAMPTTRFGDGRIGVQKTIDVSHEMV